MAVLANMLFSPVAHFILLAVLVGVAFFFKFHKTAGALTVVLLVYLWFVFLSSWPLRLLAAQENTYPVVQVQELDTALTYHIMVLGAGVIHRPGYAATLQMTRPQLARLVEGVRLYRGLPRATVIGVGFTREGERSMAELLTSAAVELGVSPSDTAMLGAATTTMEEAMLYASRFGTETPLILVTSANHLPRAVRWFESAGIPIIPAPADFRTSSGPLLRIQPADGTDPTAPGALTPASPTKPPSSVLFWNRHQLMYWHDWLHEQAGMIQLWLEGA